MDEENHPAVDSGNPRRRRGTTSDGAAHDRIVGALEVLGGTVRDNGDGKAQAQCPAHDDNNPSLSITHRHDGKGAVLHCHAGCDVTDVVAALGLTMSDLFDDQGLRAAYSPTATYVYSGGRQVHRKPNKDFPQSGNKKDRSLFHGDQVAGATTVHVVEGRAGKAHLADWSALEGKHVVVIADIDEAGRKHAAQVAERLGGIAASIRIVEAVVGKDLLTTLPHTVPTADHR
jgi:hypothetical protein